MPWLGTFHSIGVKILRRHAELVGLKSDFTILDTDDQIRLLKQLIQRREHRREALAGAPARRPHRRLEEPRPDARQGPRRRGHAFANGKGAELYAAYQERLKTLNAADFGDLLLACPALFARQPGRARGVPARFRYILVDEYQDTNVAQYLWLRLLAQGHRNICCVGDDDQSIYGWRGAEVDNILRFEKDFPGAR
jgi:DNA helicase II / ATP-dependent DNA helicase PcrA